MIPIWLWIIPVALVAFLLFKWGKTRILIGLIVAILALWAFKACSDDKKNKVADDTTSATQQQEDQQRSRVRAPELNDPLDVLGVRSRSGGAERRTFRFADHPTGCFPLYLRSDVMFYPLNGQISVQTPRGRTHIIDSEKQSDEQKLTDLTVGIYIICSLGAPFTDIWTNWAQQP